MTYKTTMAADRRFGGHQMLGTEKRAAGIMIPPTRAAVKPDGQTLLLDQALAAEQRALASAAWHFERAARYLGWAGDNMWAAQRYREHVGEAEFQQRLAARHRQIAASLEGVTR